MCSSSSFDKWKNQSSFTVSPSVLGCIYLWDIYILVYADLHITKEAKVRKKKVSSFLDLPFLLYLLFIFQNSFWQASKVNLLLLAFSFCSRTFCFSCQEKWDLCESCSLKQNLSSGSIILRTMLATTTAGIYTPVRFFGGILFSHPNDVVKNDKLKFDSFHDIMLMLATCIFLCRWKACIHRNDIWFKLLMTRADCS